MFHLLVVPWLLFSCLLLPHQTSVSSRHKDGINIPYESSERTASQLGLQAASLAVAGPAMMSCSFKESVSVQVACS